MKFLNAASNNSFWRGIDYHHEKRIVSWEKLDKNCFRGKVKGSDGEVDHYNVFHASLLIRHLEDGKKYLYDIIDIKKETSNLFQS